MKRLILALALTSIPVFALTVSGTPPQGTVGVAYSYTFTASAGVAPYTFSASGLPSGLSLSPSGVLSGTPTAAVQNLAASIVVTDTTGAKASQVVLFQIGNAPASTPLAIANSALANGSVGIPYNQIISATGGTLPYSAFMLVSGTLPAGLSLTLSSGTGLLTATVSGTPTIPGTSTFTVQVSDLAGQVASKTLSLTISNFTITSGGPGVLDTSGIFYSPLVPGAVGVAYSQPITVSGGTPPYAFSVIAGSLPSGLGLSANGTLAGTPAFASASQFTVQATDSASLITQKSFSLTIVPPGPLLTGVVLLSGTVGTGYSQSLTPTGGTPPYTFAIAAGSLPAGLSLSPGGVISGTPTVAAFNAPFTVQVTDNAGIRASQALSLTIQPTPLTITTTATLPAASLGAPYSQNLIASGGIPPYQFGFVSGTSPAGLAISSAGVLGGTPAAAGTFTFTIGVLDTPGTTGFGLHIADKTFTLTVSATPVTITTASPLPSGLTGAPYSQTLAASGGRAPYTFALAAGTLPPGLTLAGSGTVGGTPTAAGTFNFTAQVTDSQSQTASKALAITITSSLGISTGSTLPGATVGAAYSQALTASGGTGPLVFSIASGTLAGGLTLSSSGLLSGTPIAAGSFNFTAQVADSSSTTITKNFSLTVSPAPLTLSTDSTLTPGSVAVPYSQTLTATGGTPPYTFALAGCCLPTGLGISSGGVISGTPTPAGTYNFTVSVTDSASGSVSKPFSLVINPSPITIVTGSSLPTATVGVSYSVAFTAAGGTGTGLGFTTSSGNAPPGLSFDTTSLSGIPTAAGSYSFTLTFADSGSAPVSKAFTLTVNPAGLAITTGSSLPGATVGTAYSQKLAATAGTPPYAFAVSSGALPGGLTLGPDGTLAGTPTVPGAFTFSVQATDAASKTASQTFTLAVGASPLIVSTATLSGGRVGAAYSQAISASGGTPPYTFTVVSGTLPAGLALSSAGALSGTPTAPGNFGFTVQVSDSAGLVTAQSFSVAIGPAGLTISTPSPLPVGATGSAYSQTLTVAGGTSPYTFTLMSGALPAGVNLSSGGTLAGTPTATGTFAFTVQATDSAALSAAMAYSLTITGTTLSIPTLSPLVSGSVGIAYSQAIAAAGGTPPYTYTLAAGSLPSGVTLSSAGFLTGTPTSAGSFTFAVQATDSTGATVSKIFNVTIAAGGVLVFSTSTLPNASVGIAYNQNLLAIGGTAPYRFTLVAGALPAGLALSATGGLSGTPTVAGVFNFTLQATDAAGLVTAKALSITVGGSSLSIGTSEALTGGTVGVTYTQTFAVSGGTPPYIWTVVAGAPPPGLALNSSGVLSGTPSTAGTFSFTAQVADASGAKATTQVSVVIGAASVPSIVAVVNAASYAPGGLSPGEIVTIFGTGMGPASIVTAQSSTPGFLDTALANTRVLFNDVAAPLIYISDKQVSAIVPYGIAGVASVKTVVEYRGVPSQPILFAPVDSAPGLFSADASGRGPGAILNQDYSLNSASNPAPAGSVVLLYATGEGATDPAGIDGKVTTDILARPKLPVTVTIGGLPAEVLYAGAAPGIVAGGLQINVRIPAGLTSRNPEVVVNVGVKASQVGLTVAVQ